MERPDHGDPKVTRVLTADVGAREVLGVALIDRAIAVDEEVVPDVGPAVAAHVRVLHGARSSRPRDVPLHRVMKGHPIWDVTWSHAGRRPGTP